jgi:hypothetical protein
MRHLHPDELIDLADGTRPESSAPHLTACAECRRQLAELRGTMAAAAQAEVPEPSPLFWDHFSARVHDAVAAEGAPRRAPWLGLAPPLWAAACAAVIIAAAVTMRVARAPGFVATPVGPVASLAPLADDAADLAPLADDPSLDLVADLAAQVGWDGAAAPGLGTHEDAADNAVGQLTAAERSELQRLLKEELARPGA